MRGFDGVSGGNSAAYAAEQGMLKLAADALETRCAQTVQGVFPPLRLSIPKFGV